MTERDKNLTERDYLEITYYWKDHRQVFLGMGKFVENNLKLLLTQVKEGSEKSFQLLFDSYSPPIYAYCLSLVKNKYYAEEIVQDVFIKVWVKRETLNPELSFKSYLFTITKNASFNFLKKAAKDIKLREEVFYLSQKSYAQKVGHIQETDIEKVKQQLIDLLPPKRKQIFEMSRNENKSYLDISEELGISMNTVKSQMNKALKTIRSYLSTYENITPALIVFLSDWIL